MGKAVLTYRAVVALIATGLLSLAGLAAASSASAAQGRAAIAGTHPAWAQGAPGASPATTAPSSAVNLRVYLAGQDPAGLAAYAKDVSTPGSALYSQYLTPAQVESRFGATSAEVSAVKAWLTGAGLTVTDVSAGAGAYVAVTGTLAQASKAFDVTFGAFQGPDKKMDRAPEQAASAPSSVGGDVLAVSGLDTATHQMKPGDTLPPPDPNYWVAGPTSTYYGQKVATNEPKAYGRYQPWNVTGYTPRQIRGAYGVSQTGMTGRGQTVAVIDAYASPTMLSDANQYAKVTGDRPFGPRQYQQYLPSSYTQTGPDECDAPGWYGEETLDVESVHGEAPDATVHYVGGASCDDVDLAAAVAEVVQHRLASIVTDSWLEPADEESIASVYDNLFERGAAEGIGFLFSSGDDGYENPAEDPASDQQQTDYPAESPWVTAVGGTSLAIGQRNNYEFETSWGTLLDPLSSSGTSWEYTPPGVYPDYYDGSSGGGVSTNYTQPFYQRGVVPNSLATHLPNGTTSSTPMRVVPDVSALADPSTGFLVGQTTLQPDGKTYAFSLSRIGGTSLSSPTMAGIEADAQQAAGRPIGFADPAIYARHNTRAYHDVTDFPFGRGVRLAEVRNNYTDPYTMQGPIVTYLRTLGIDGEGSAALPAVQGYDDATGVGSPTADYIESFAHGRR
jgi:subtilase family serine protease